MQLLSIFLLNFCSQLSRLVILDYQGLDEELGIYMVAIDRPGYGESDPDPKRSEKSLALDIEDFADRLKLGATFYVIGHSMGGEIVWGCLKYIPHRFDFFFFLILVNP